MRLMDLPKMLRLMAAECRRLAFEAREARTLLALQHLALVNHLVSASTSDVRTSIPSVFAVCRLITSANSVDSAIDRSDGFVARRIRST
jgi:hypothetical protein